MSILRGWIENPATRLPLVLLLAGAAAAQTPSKATSLAEADKTIEGLREISRELADAVKRFHADLDENVARYDRGYRAKDDRVFQGADTGLNGGPADVVEETVRKFAAFRILAARSGKYSPPPVADMDRIQDLIAEAHQRVNASASVLRGLLVISAKDFDAHRDAAMKSRHDQLLKARGAAEEAAKQAWLALPIDVPEAESADERNQKAWDILSRGWPNGTRGGGVTPTSEKAEGPAPALPIRIARRRRFTLFSDASYRMALTDSGTVDANGRHLFYQEEWIQRGTSVIRARWRVALDTDTGDHVLVKRYPMLELRGAIDDLYKAMNRYSLWYLEPGDEAVRPAPEEVEAALAEVEDARVGIQEAMEDFQNATRASLARHDRDRMAGKMPLLDAGLAGPIREALYAIRAHLAGVRSNLEAENKVWATITEAERRVASLEAVASWANRIPGEEATSASGVEWEQLLERSDRAIDLVRIAEYEAAAVLPPNSSQAEARFPAIQRGVIVRIRRPPAQSSQKGMVLCRQEIWHMEIPMPGAREVRRTATLVEIDPRTGAQVAVAGRTKYYPVDDGNILENVFDQHSADDLPLAVID